MDVQFNEERSYRASYARPEARGLAAWLTAHSGGLIKNQRSAAIFLVTFCVLALIASSLVLFTTGPSPSPEALKNPRYGLPEVD